MTELEREKDMLIHAEPGDRGNEHKLKAIHTLKPPGSELCMCSFPLIYISLQLPHSPDSL